MSKSITVQTTVNTPVESVWKAWTEPEHITKWNYASDDWECPHATNDLRAGGKFNYRMQSRDKQHGFDFTGVYTKVMLHELIEYTMDDGRKVSVKFEDIDGKTNVIETFEMESMNSEELQREGWQSILNNFKKHAEYKEI